MKTLIFVVLALATFGCKPCQKAVKPEDCDIELKKEIAEKWKEYKDKHLEDGSFYWRNDDFANNLQRKFSNCIIGKSKQEMLELFGKTRHNEQRQLIYDCIKGELKDGTHPICLRFWFDESGKVQKILYDYCWGHQ